VYVLDDLSEGAERILLFLWLHGEKTNNELRKEFSPTTLNKQLPLLTKNRLVQMRKMRGRGRGAWRNSYSLASAGYQWIEEPVDIFANVYHSVIQTVARLLQLKETKLESQLHALDLLKGKVPHRLKFRAEFSEKNDRWLATASWTYNEENNLNLDAWTFEPMSAQPMREQTGSAPSEASS
jgi:hypothetical protein